MVRDDQPDAREGQAGHCGVAERLVVPLKPGSAGGGKGPQFKTDAGRSEGPWRLGNLSTPNSVQKLQTALHAKAKAEPGYRFYALYDKISREDILAHAYAQCRSNKGAPGVDRQDFEAVEAYGSSDGWANWRLRSGRRPTDRFQSDACTYRRPTANSGRWASQPCGIGSA